MNGNNIPKRNKTTKSTSAKKGQCQQCQQQTNKQQKRKVQLKKCISTQCSTTTLAKSSSQPKLSKQQKKKKDKQRQRQRQKQKYTEKQTQKSKSKQRPKTITKNKVTKKKVLKTKQNDMDNCQRTMKKFLKKKKQIEEELTERKKIHMEYFMYKDVCLPIQNTEQRKIVFKIQLIDQNVQRKNKFRECDQSRYHKTRKSVEVIKKDTACQKTDRKLEITDYECQTEYVAEVPQQNRNSGDTQQQPQKCFAETLSQLQFLYLPDQKNFQNFTRSQKAHYKQLLLYMAKKFEQPQQILDQSTIESMLHDRYLKQRGVMESYPKKGIPTHTSAVISYVSNLFCFMEIHDKTNFIDRINCSYGYSMFQKLARVKAHRSTRMNSQLISQATFWKFQAELHDGLQFQDQVVEKALHSHNRAIFDAVNQALLQFQPYFSSQGQPFPWSYNFQTTFYCISQSSYSALVCQVKDKIWQQCTTLAGILLQLQHEKPYKAHFTRILSIQQQMLQTELKKQNNRVDIDQCRTRVLCQVSDLIELEILKEIVGFFYLC